MPDDHSKLVPLLPIPNRTVKRLSADDSADSRVKVGHRQALIARNARLIFDQPGVFFCASASIRLACHQAEKLKTPHGSMRGFFAFTDCANRNRAP